MNLSDKYKKKAIDLGLCEKWTKEWKDNSSKEELVQKFIEGNDFCIINDFPSVEEIKTDFGDVINDFGIYADQDVFIDGKGFIMLCGKSKANIVVKDIFCDIYIRHHSEAKITVYGSGRAFVRMCDNSFADVHSYGSGRAYVYDYCGATVKINGNVVVRDKSDRYKKQ